MNRIERETVAQAAVRLIVDGIRLRPELIEDLKKRAAVEAAFERDSSLRAEDQDKFPETLERVPPEERIAVEPLRGFYRPLWMFFASFAVWYYSRAALPAALCGLGALAIAGYDIFWRAYPATLYFRKGAVGIYRGNNLALTALRETVSVAPAWQFLLLPALIPVFYGVASVTTIGVPLIPDAVMAVVIVALTLLSAASLLRMLRSSVPCRIPYWGGKPEAVFISRAEAARLFGGT